MVRRAVVAALAAACAFLGFATTASPQAGPNQQPLPFTITAPGQSSGVFNLSGQSSCAVVVYNSGSGLVLVPQATSDTMSNIANGSAIWSTVSTIGSGAISTFGNYVGNVAAVGLTGFRVTATSLSSGPVQGSIYCSNASSGSGGGGGGGTVVVSSAPPLTIASLPPIQISPSSQPSPCATYSAGVCETYTVNTIAATGPTTITANGTYTATLSGVHAGCDVQTNGGWIGTIAAQTQGSNTGYLPAKIYSQTSSSTSTVSPGVSSVQAASSDYWVPTSLKVGVELIVTNYALGNVTIRCDVAPPQWVEAIPVSGGVGFGAGGINSKVGFLQTITLAQNVTGSGTAQLVALSSVSGLVPNMTVALTTGGGETVTLLAVYPGNNTVSGIFADSHSTGDTVIPSSSQTLSIVLGGNQNSCTIRTDSSFNGTILAKVTNGSSLYNTRDAIGTTSAVSTALMGYLYTTMVGASASWSVPVGSELGFQIMVSGATAGSFQEWCDVGMPPPISVLQEISPSIGSASWSPSQVTLTLATAALIVAARVGNQGTGRVSVTIVNNSTTPIALGNLGVTYTTGVILPGVVGASITLPTTAAVYGVLQSSGSALVSYYEVY